jgi:hypothetical protein
MRRDDRVVWRSGQRSAGRDNLSQVVAVMFGPAVRLQHDEMVRRDVVDPQAVCDEDAAEGLRQFYAVAVVDTAKRPTLIA